jgi:AAA+ ATPase superfamily predicted ATPase
MWVYGPKSTGKTTLIEYILENELDSKEYNIKYINFRRTLIGSFDNFIESFIEEKDEDQTQTELNRNYNLFGLFKLEAKTLKKIKENRKNIFNYLMEEFNKEKRKNIFIIDEIQSLEDIYIDENKKLLSEFLNFCIALTKETHLSHVLILTSNTIFLNQIYNNAKMKVTSDFKLIDHLPFNEIKNWLLSKDLGFSIMDIELIYEYLGGSVAHIKKLIDFKDEYSSIKEQLEEMAQIAKNEIIFEKNQNLTNKEFELFLQIAKRIVEDKRFIFDESDEKKRKELSKVINRFCDIEILFFDPIKNITTANSQIYVKAMQMLL